MLDLTGRFKKAVVPIETGKTILDHALMAEVDVGFSCLRGTCGRCRCQIEAGMELLNRVTDEEWERLEEDELEQGYRLGCQAVIRSEGTVKALHKPYY